jgi:phosphatidylserine/phosphatidylglycerophosphate/cardiolipin synthase-like enzyme
VVPRYPDVDGRLSLPPNLVGRQHAIEACRSASPERVHIFDVENHEGTPVYVHAKVCVIDDTWASVGSDNLNRRSWTHDSELSCAVIDDTGVFARDLRLRLLREHLDRAADGSEDDGLVDSDTVVDVIESSARALEEWYTNGCRGSRPPGRLRPHRPEKLGRVTQLWAAPVYRAIYDPDGRSYRARLKNEW